MNVILSISKSAVFNEVAQTTSYTGAKMDDDANAYERITTVDEDQSELKRFWDESRAEVAQAFIRMLVSEGMAEDGDTYNLVLNVSVAFDNALQPGMELGLFSYFVQSITASGMCSPTRKRLEISPPSARASLTMLRKKLSSRRSQCVLHTTNR